MKSKNRFRFGGKFRENPQIFREKNFGVFSKRRRRCKRPAICSSRLQKYLFDPTRETNKETKATLLELTDTAIVGIITELEDERKATYKCLEISGSNYCFANCSDERKAALLGVTATNDEAESALGSVTRNIQPYWRVNIHAAAAIASAKQTKIFQRTDAKRNCSRVFFSSI